MSQSDCPAALAKAAGKSRSYQGFSTSELAGEVSAAYAGEGLLSEVERLVDPASATETIHWGRNYIYTARMQTPAGSIEVVVKQFRNLGWRRSLQRRLRGSKAARSWQVAKALLGAGIATPEPVLLVESKDPQGPSFYISRRLTGASEVRQFFRRINRASDAGEFPEIEALDLLARLGQLARQLHDAGICYRDLSIGNILAKPAADGTLELFLVDFNRARLDRRLGVLARSRDICRLPIVQPQHRQAFLSGYWGQAPPRHSPRWWLYTASVRGYLLKHAIKNRLRRKPPHRQRIATGGRHHAHIPAAETGASVRDKIVWDRLSDQPHQHAGTFEKLRIRLSDSGSHLHDLAIVAAAAPRVWRRYRELQRQLYRQPTPFQGIGLCLRPWPGQLPAQLSAIADLGVSSLLLRLHPWEDDHDDEEELAQSLVESGYELALALPQNRDLVRDRRRWRDAVEELAERFSPYSCHFQVGQAVNRSKWGIWTRREALDLYLDAAEILRRQPEAVVMGPAVIDFEHQVTMALVNRRAAGLHYDIVSSLLYVDRRGAPECRQLGFDTVDKVVLLRAIAETGHSCSERCWLTEVNWPLWEGPHSPAGRKVSVSEEAQADYLARYYLLSIGTGLVERVFWWRLLARGYGLMASDADGRLLRRPSYQTLQTLITELDGATFLGPLPAGAGSYLYHFRREHDEVVAAWSVAPNQVAELPRPASAVVSRDGQSLPLPTGVELTLQPSPSYYHLANE
jgi:tRNA A-37 threonylcarbamoyl transferase component Bud32